MHTSKATTTRDGNARQPSHSKLLTRTGATRNSSAVSAVKSAAATPRSEASVSVRSSSSSSSASSSRSTGEASVVKKKVDEILKRMLPHSIVQSYEKISAALKTQVVVAVNGELLEAVEPEQGPMNAKWVAQQDAVLSSMASAKKKPSQHPFHYARSVQYASTHPELSLNESFKLLDVTLTSLTSGYTAQWFKASTTVLTKKSWRLVAETDRKIGLALYELPLGPWSASSLVVLVWAKTLEVVNLYVQLHVAEMLYNCPQRAIRILPDDVDKAHGLHSFTAAVTIRSFHSTFWEHEVFSIAFPALDGAQDTTSVDLLDEESGYRDRARFIASPVGTTLATDAISVLLEDAVVVDFTLWESSCNPIWGFSKLLSVATRDAPRTASDFSMSVAGEKRQLLEIRYGDAIRGNTLAILLEKPLTTAAPKKPSVFVKQVTLELGVAFINKTFGTNYAVKSKASK